MPLQVRVGQRDLRGEIALRRADVDEGPVVLPGKLPGDGHVGAVADAGHGGEELLQSRRVGVEGLEQPGPAALDLVLRLPGAERLGQVPPERIEAVVRHLEDAAHVGRLLPVEEEIGLRACCA